MTVKRCAVLFLINYLQLNFGKTQYLMQKFYTS